jgi:hypothetical protein
MYPPQHIARTRVANGDRLQYARPPSHVKNKDDIPPYVKGGVSSAFKQAAGRWIHR